MAVPTPPPDEKKKKIEEIKRRLRDLRVRIEKWAMVKIADVGEMNTVYREIGEVLRELAKLNPSPEAKVLTDEAHKLLGELSRMKTPYEEKVLRIFTDAGASAEELELVKEGLRLWAEGQLSSEQLYYYLVGIAYELMIPLTPRQVGDLREALGLPRSW